MQEIEFNNYSRNANKICLETSPHDFKSFKIFIPFHDYPEINGHCVLLKGPSRSHWVCNHKLFEEVAAESGKQIDKLTTRAIKCNALGIKQFPERNCS
eukprot:5456876-Ditylum_brightwellii.AAC.1